MTAPYGVRHALFPAVLVILSAGITTPLLAEDAPSLNQSEWDLRTYSMCAADVRPVADLVMSIAGRGNVVLVPDTREVLCLHPLRSKTRSASASQRTRRRRRCFRLSLRTRSPPETWPSHSMPLLSRNGFRRIGSNASDRRRCVGRKGVRLGEGTAADGHLGYGGEMERRQERRPAPLPERRTDDVAGSVERRGAEKGKGTN